MHQFVYHRIELLLMCLLLELDTAITVAEVAEAVSDSQEYSFPGTEIQKSAYFAHHDQNRIRSIKSRRHDNNIRARSRNSIASIRPLQEPFRNNNTVVTAQTGTTATLDCYIGTEDVTVIWVKTYPNSSQMWLLTINDTTITDDKRFSAQSGDKMNIWTLRIKYTRTSDEGLYECQVCNHPTSSIYVRLSLVEAFAEILDDEKTEKHGGIMTKTVDKGFPIRLSCILHNSIRVPDYIFWYHGNKVINYELKDTASVREGRMGSELIFRRAEPENAGNYTCIPSNALPASIMVKVNYKEASPQVRTNAASEENKFNETLFKFCVIFYLLLIQ